MLTIIFYKINYFMSACFSQRLLKSIFFEYKYFICTLVIPLSLVTCDQVNNTTEFEIDLNYAMYNDSYENFTLLDQNISELDTDNKTFDLVTELESSITVTEDSDSSFQSENSRKLFLFLTPDKDICNCDLTSNFCDINCCCDPDCKEEDMQIFSECTHQVLTIDENYCYQENIILRNNTVYKMVKNSENGMFCIMHDNFKHHLRFRDMPILKSHRDLVAVLKYKYKTTYSWDTLSENIYDPIFDSKLRVGNPIYIDMKLNEKNITSYWSLPSSCLSDMCSCQEDVKYLRDFHSSCSFFVGDLEEQCEENELLAADHVSNFCINPRSTASHASSSGSLADLVMHTKVVGSTNVSDEDYYSSSQVNRICAKKSRERPKIHLGACENVVRHVRFTVEQDGAIGITGLRVEFEYANVSLHKQVLTQSYSVSFVWSNASESSKKSGNPGYQIGLPILAATNGSDSGEEEMSRAFYKVGLGVLDREAGGGNFCSRTRRRVIQFGKNLKTGCVLKKTSASCKALQNAVSDVLLGPSRRQIFVGVFGNANVSEPDDWIEVFYEGNDPQDGLSDKNCFASLGLKIDVVYAAVGTVANPQHKIVGVSYHFTELVDLVAVHSIALSTSVSFFDVTLPAVERYAKVPSIKVNLPSDFFYPFLYGRSSKDLPSIVCLVTVIQLCLYYCNIKI